MLGNGSVLYYITSASWRTAVGWGGSGLSASVFLQLPLVLMPQPKDGSDAVTIQVIT